MAYPLKAHDDLDEAPATRRAPIRMSYEQFLESGDDLGHAEWVNGEVIRMSPASNRHQDLLRFLTLVIGFFVEQRGLGTIRFAPFQMKLAPDLPGREPDLIFISTANLGRILKNRLDGPADLAIEIVSPDSVDRDLVQKFAEYAQGGVREYWIIDPDRGLAQFFALGDDRRYRPIPPAANGRIPSLAIPGLLLDPAWLFADPLPSASEALKALGAA